MSVNRIDNLFLQKKGPVLSIFFTAGFPNLQDTIPLAKALEAAGVDMLEIGMPYSDPLADGPVIQQSSTQALENGMSIPILLEQLKELRAHVNIPVLLMGYFNPLLQYGLDAFEQEVIACGVDGLIVPDMPLEQLQKRLNRPWGTDLKRVLLISPQTSDERISTIASLATGFLYIVSSTAVTGGTGGIQSAQETYFKRIASLDLPLPTVVGFGISDQRSFQAATSHCNGAIVGSAFIKFLQTAGPSWQSQLPSFIHNIRPA